MKLSEKETLYLQAKEAYYEGDPIMTDFQFDALEMELKTAESPVIGMVGFKTKGVKYEHLTPMKSLDKIQFQLDYVPYKEFSHWLSQNPSKGGMLEASPKFDGNAVNLIYKNGFLHKAITRGDGTEGQDITDKLRHIVPTQINLDKTLEIRGEVVIKVKTFDEKYAVDYKNARNFVAGMLNRDQLEMDILKDLDFLGFEIKMNETTWLAVPLEHLKHWGFEEVYHENYVVQHFDNPDNFQKMFESFSDYRYMCPYQLDGWVIKFGNEMRTPDMENDHHPKWALAVKFPPKIGRTRIIDIEWNLGTTGTLVPTGLLDPVDLDGSTVQRVTLYNYGWAAERNLGIGSEIEIVKSGDIIPKVHNILSLGEDFTWPTTWNGHNTYADDIHLRVNNHESLGEFRVLKLYGGIVALGLKGIGQKMAGRLYRSGIVKEIGDLFTPEFNKENLIRSGEFVDGRELEIVLEIVQNVKEIEFWKVINALQITGAGKTLSKQIANYYAEVDYDFAGLEKAVVDKFLHSTKEYGKMNHFLNVLGQNGIKVVYPQKVNNDLVIGTYEMTGSPKEQGFKVKSEFVALAEQKGFVHGKLTKDCNFLITDNLSATSSKMKKAEKLGVEIITYANFATKYLNK